MEQAEPKTCSEPRESEAPFEIRDEAVIKLSYDYHKSISPKT
jgi:hypothetical protein